MRHLGHVSDGYTYMMSLGFDEVARVCLTHSFHNQTTDEYIGRFDTTEEELELIQKELSRVTFDEYDLLIQLCDSLAGAEGVLDIEEKMGVRSCFPQGKKKTKKCDISSIVLCYELWNGIVCGSVVK